MNDRVLNVGIVTFGFGPTAAPFVVKHAQELQAHVFAQGLDPVWASSLGGVRKCYNIGSAIWGPTDLLRRSLVGISRACFAWPGIRQPRASAEALECALAETGVNVVLTEWGHLAMAILPVVRRLGLPLVPHFHGYDLSVCYRRRWYRKRLPDLLDYARAIVVVNSLQRDRLARVGCPPGKIHRIPCGAEVQAFVPPKRSTGNGVTFLAVGRMVEKKAPLLSIKAFVLVKRQCKNVSLVMLGDGPLRADAMRLVRKLGLELGVQLVGSQPHLAVQDYMRRADVFVQHSITSKDGDEEGCPVSIAEAAASGLPVVSTRTAGIPENVLDYVTGFLVEEGDWRAMAERMVQLAEDRALRERMGMAGRLHIERHGNAGLQIEKLRRVLHDASGVGV